MFVFWYDNVFTFHIILRLMKKINHSDYHNQESESKYLQRFNVIQICSKLFISNINDEETTSPSASTAKKQMV